MSSESVARLLPGLRRPDLTPSLRPSGVVSAAALRCRRPVWRRSATQAATVSGDFGVRQPSKATYSSIASLSKYATLLFRSVRIMTCRRRGLHALSAGRLRAPDAQEQNESLADGRGSNVGR